MDSNADVISVVMANPVSTVTDTGGSYVSLWADLNCPSGPTQGQPAAAPDPSAHAVTEKPEPDQKRTP